MAGKTLGLQTLKPCLRNNLLMPRDQNFSRRRDWPTMPIYATDSFQCLDLSTTDNRTCGPGACCVVVVLLVTKILGC